MHADNINEFKSENISKKIQDEAGDLIDGEVYFINFWYIYNKVDVFANENQVGN